MKRHTNHDSQFHRWHTSRVYARHPVVQSQTTSYTHGTLDASKYDYFYHGTPGEQTSQIVVSLVFTEKEKKSYKRLHWVHPLNLDRNIYGAFVILFQNLRQDKSKYLNYFCMSVKSFDEFLRKLQDYLIFQNTHLRESVPAAERFVVTIRYIEMF